MAHLLESFGALDKLEGFVSKNGRAFYKYPIEAQKHTRAVVTLRRTSPGKLVDEKYMLGNESLVPFWAGKEIGWQIVKEDTD